MTPKGAEDFVLAQFLTTRQPFGPRDADALVRADPHESDQLFDRNNLIYAQTSAATRPTYIIGRKGAGKTAFLRGATMGDDGPPRCVLSTASIYAEMVALLRQYREARGPLFVPQTAEIWLALFDHVALFHACETTANDDPPHEMQIVWDYTLAEPQCDEDPTAVAERFLAELQKRIDDREVRGLRELIDGLTRGGISFGTARKAVRAVLHPRPLMIVMDNLEDLHARIFELEEVLAGLFHGVQVSAARNPDRRPYGLQLCLPSELWGEIHRISANPEKDFGGNYLIIYWTARELLHLVARRYRLFMQAHHPGPLEELERRAAAGVAHRDIAVLRAALPETIRGGLGVDEDPLAYILRHTQLLPRHLIEILNNVFTAPVPGSPPWAVTPEAVRIGTQIGERMIVEGIFAAHRATFPRAPEAVKRLANRLTICFPARQLRTVFNREGISSVTGHDFDDFRDMLITLGVLGVKVDDTARYHQARFQYTFGSSLNAHEDLDDLCFHPLFTRYLFEHALDDLRDKQELPTYPFGCDPDEGDYRMQLGYAERGRYPR